MAACFLPSFFSLSSPVLVSLLLLYIHGQFSFITWRATRNLCSVDKERKMGNCDRTCYLSGPLCIGKFVLSSPNGQTDRSAVGGQGPCMMPRGPVHSSFKGVPYEQVRCAHTAILLRTCVYVYVSVVHSSFSRLSSRIRSLSRLSVPGVGEANRKSPAA